MVSKNFWSKKSIPLYPERLNISVMSEEQKERAQYIWSRNIDGEAYIYDPDEISDKLTLIDSGTIL
tara:strand:+ start:348 stop:545 length:198 start_codon:yes stop_codon:yes gene_type:complete